MPLLIHHVWIASKLHIYLFSKFICRSRYWIGNYPWCTYYKNIALTFFTICLFALKLPPIEQYFTIFTSLAQLYHQINMVLSNVIGCIFQWSFTIRYHNPNITTKVFQFNIKVNINDSATNDIFWNWYFILCLGVYVHIEYTAVWLVKLCDK